MSEDHPQCLFRLAARRPANHPVFRVLAPQAAAAQQLGEGLMSERRAAEAAAQQALESEHQLNSRWGRRGRRRIGTRLWMST